MAGGIGSRLWPLSRSSFPKQYQALVDNEDGYTMLQQTFSRLEGLNLGLSQQVKEIVELLKGRNELKHQRDV